MVLAKEMRTTQRGFTLIEMVMTIAMVAVLAAISLPVYRQFQVQNDVDVAAITTTQSLRRAQLLAQAGEGDSEWGVRVDAASITVFKGATYAGRDALQDEVFSYPSTISRSGVQEVVFSRIVGEPSTTGTITFTSVEGDARSVTINAKGMVSY